MKKRGKKVILVVTGSRAEYGLLLPVMREIEKSRKLALRVLVTGMHTQQKYGHTIDLIRRDKVRIDAVVSVGENDSMLGALVKEIRGIEAYCTQHRPDLILVLGDRDEPFAAAVVAGHMGVALAHMSGGDTLGYLVDEPIRHSISKFAHVHFPITKQSARRIEALGEEKKRIHLVGSTAFDGVALGRLKSKKELAKEFGLDMDLPWLLVVQHPASLDKTLPRLQITPTIEALRGIRAEKIVIYPNSDTGSDVFLTALRSVSSEQHFTLAASLSRMTYLAFLKHAGVLVGNSSSGMIETGRFKLPVVDIGGRQIGRERGANVIHVDYDAAAIKRAITRALAPSFRARVMRARDPYVSHGASPKIVRVLEGVRLDQQLFHKTMPL